MSTARRIHHSAHLAHRLGDPREHGHAHDRVSDVELFDLGDGRDWRDIAHGEAVPGVHFESERDGLARTSAQRGERALVVRVVRVGAGVQFNRLGTQPRGALNDHGHRVNKERRADSRGAESGDRGLQHVARLGHVEPAFRCHLGALLRHEGDLRRPQPFGNQEHLLGAGHLEVERGPAADRQLLDVGVLHVPPIFPQVRRNAVRAGRFACQGGCDGVGFIGLSRLPDGGDVVDVNAETKGQHRRKKSGGMGRTGSRLLIMLTSRHACWHSRAPLSFPYPSETESRVKRVACVLLVLVACRTVPVSGGAGSPNGAGARVASGTASGTDGAPSARLAVDRFLAAAREQDLATLGTLFGDEAGPARARDDARAFEQREVIMVCALRHDQAKVTEGAASVGGKVIFNVDLVQGLLQATTKFTAVRGPSGRWFVSEFDIVTLQNKGFCRSAGMGKTPDAEALF